MKEHENDNLGMRLLKKGQKGIVHAIFSRFGVLLIILLIQFLILLGMFVRFQEFLPQYTGLNALLSIVLMLYLINSDIITYTIVATTVGTINLDYRSLYHHFECGVYLYQIPCITDIEADFQNTLTKCRKITKLDVKKEKIYYKILGALMKVVAPLM